MVSFSPAPANLVGFLFGLTDLLLGQWAFFVTEDLDDMIPIIRLNGLADFPNFQREGCFFEFSYHWSAGKPAQVTTLVVVAGVRRYLQCHGSKIFTCIQAVEHSLRLFFGGNEDMPRPDLFSDRFDIFGERFIHLCVQKLPLQYKSRSCSLERLISSAASDISSQLPCVYSSLVYGVGVGVMVGVEVMVGVKVIVGDASGVAVAGISTVGLAERFDYQLFLSPSDVLVGPGVGRRVMVGGTRAIWLGEKVEVL